MLPKAKTLGKRKRPIFVVQHGSKTIRKMEQELAANDGLLKKKIEELEVEKAEVMAANKEKMEKDKEQINHRRKKLQDKALRLKM